MSKITNDGLMQSGTERFIAVHVPIWQQWASHAVTCCRDNVVTIMELLESIRKLQNVSDSSKLEKIARVLDEDHDGVIDKTELMEVTTGRVSQLWFPPHPLPMSSSAIPPQPHKF